MKLVTQRVEDHRNEQRRCQQQMGACRPGRAHGSAADG